jgi:HAD superfamily hydrolase (TIGR01509 family)
MRPDLQAVLFDMDGTLVETEQHWGVALFELADRLGGRLSAAARERTVGSSMRTAMTIVYADLGIARSEEQLRADARWVELRAQRLMSEGVTWRPGARELLLEVRNAGLPTALVTTTGRDVAAVVLDLIAADCGGCPFDLTVCGDEVPARKPDPAPYRQAMATLRVPAAGSVVVEDSLAGVTAGQAAGAAVVLGVPSLQPLDPAPGLTLLPTLAGVHLADLRALVEDEAADPAA